jgi:RNA polymerase sigma factor (sigma-70 family)
LSARNRDLDQWVDGIRARSNAAFRAVYRSMANDLVSFAIGMLGDRRAAEDTVQQAFVELVNAAPGLRGNGRSLQAWMYRSVRYGCLDEIRRRQRRLEAPSAHLPERAGVVEPDHDLDPDLASALAQLSDRQRELVVLRHVVGLDGNEIAAATRSNRAAVYAALGRAERRLRGLLDAKESTP